MENVVTMDLEYYNDLNEKIRKLEDEIEKMKLDRIEELKDIIKLGSGYSNLSINLDLTEIIKELYGDEIDNGEYVYKLRDSEFKSRVYDVYELIREE